MPAGFFKNGEREGEKEKEQKKPDDWDGYTGTAQEAFDQWWKWVEGDAE